MKPDLVFGFENAGWPAILTDKAGTVVRCNKAASQTFGPELAQGAKLASFWSATNPVTAEAFLDRWEKQPAASSVLKFNARGITIAYTVVVCAMQADQASYFILQFFPEMGAGIGSSESPPPDATLQKQKLDVAIKLARSVALDFKNALSGVLGHSSLLLMQAEPDHPWRKSLVEIEKAVAKGVEAAASLGSFSRAERERDPAAQGGSNLSPLLQRAAEALGPAATERGVQWEFQFERKLFAARFDEAKVQQAFTKILENALEAMPKGGRVRISTRNLDLSQPTQDRSARLDAGAYVCGEIADSGVGIEPAVLPRIFEPFFTTKSGGKHRGLGLPMGLRGGHEPWRRGGGVQRGRVRHLRSRVSPSRQTNGLRHIAFRRGTPRHGDHSHRGRRRDHRGYGPGGALLVRIPCVGDLLRKESR
jgi:nitrogen-specific signal transduction histidine kinase